VSRLVVITVKMEPEEVRKLDQLATVLKTNRSSLIRRAIKEFIDKYEKPYEGTKLKIYGETL
jgi:predicted transcriptional regulator